MTLQQLEYIVAVNRFRHFVTASEECGVTQPTLSAMIQKLEDELDVRIFDRTKHPIEPTKVGEKIIRQAEITLNESKRIKELVASEVNILSGGLKIGVIPTVAPYIIPSFIQEFCASYPTVEVSISEMRTALVVQQLENATLDMAFMSTPLKNTELLEIPIYYEKFVAYFSPTHPLKDQELHASDMPSEHLWVLQEGHCIRNQVFSFCASKITGNHTYEAGSIDNLVRIVDKNGGYTVIPEMHLPFLTDSQLTNVRQIVSPPPVREISIVIRKDYIRERMINAVADSLKKFIPPSMLDERLRKFTIRL